MKILMIAYYFPPDSSSGSFRPMHFVRHLDEMGEEVCVLTAREEDFTSYQTKDHHLLEEIPEHVKVYRSGVFRAHDAVIKLRDTLIGKPEKSENNSSDVFSKEVGPGIQPQKSWFQRFKDTITDLLSTPDQDVGWLPSAVRHGRKIIKQHKIDIMFATGRPWTCLLVGAILKKLTGVPLVIDFRDPWIGNPVFLFKGKLIRTIETYMERKAVTYADAVIANTESLRQDFLNRYPRLKPERVLSIPNGFEEYVDAPKQDRTRMTLSHTGTLIFRNPRLLLQAAINLIERGVIQKDELHIVFLGDFVLDDAELDQTLQHPFLQNVVEILPRVPYKESMKYKEESDVLFLIQPEEFPLQVPRKLYEYMAFRKPILGITPPESATGHIISDHNLGIVVPNQIAELETALETFYTQWKEAKGELHLPPTNTSDEFSNRNLTIKLSNIFKQCSEE